LVGGDSAAAAGRAQRDRGAESAESLEDDCNYTRRALALQDGPTVLVAHSYGGEVITETGVDTKVTALVYCAARGPDANEDYTALAKKFPAPPASAGIVHANGFLRLSEAAFLRDFAGDLDPVKARALYAVQAPVSDTLFTAKVTEAAWRRSRGFYAVSSNDRSHQSRPAALHGQADAGRYDRDFRPAILASSRIPGRSPA